MNDWFEKNYPRIISYALGAVWLFAAIGKGTEISAFEIELKTLIFSPAVWFKVEQSTIQILLNHLAPYFSPIALIVVLMEMMLGAMLIANLYRKAAAVASIGLFGVFGVLLAGNLLDSNAEIKTCGCFGALWEEPLSWWSVIRNGVLAGLAWVVYRGRSKERGVTLFCLYSSTKRHSEHVK